MFATAVVLFWTSVLLTCHEAALLNKTVITYNTALYEGIDLFSEVPNPPSREDRRDAIISQLKYVENDADVVCLQEVYLGEDVDKIVREVESVYPYSFSTLHDSSGSVPLNGRDRYPACGHGLFQSLYFLLFISCVEAHCDNITSVDEAIACIASRCILSYALLSQECLQCVYISGPRAKEVRQKCSQPLTYRPTTYRNINHLDLLLLSKSRMNNTRSVDYHPDSTEYTGQYGYLQAEVSDLGQVVCTHAAPYLDGAYLEPSIAYHEWITSYEEQGAAELRQLATGFGDISPVFLLGDFNVGEAVAANIKASQPANYKILTSVFQTQSHHECTFCDAPENSYNSDLPRRVFDHIFYNGFTYIAGSSTRIFDDVRVGGHPMSDHFGVKQTFTRNSQ